MPTVLEHAVGQDDNVANSSATFPTSFGPDPNALDHTAAFSKGSDQADETHEGYSSSPNQSCTSNNTTNVCKVLMHSSCELVVQAQPQAFTKITSYLTLLFLEINKYKNFEKLFIYEHLHFFSYVGTNRIFVNVYYLYLIHH